jgi:hypothetical protein
MRELLDQRLSDLRILETKFVIWSERLGSNDEIVLKIKEQLDQANSIILDLMVADQDERLKNATIE